MVTSSCQPAEEPRPTAKKRNERNSLDRDRRDPRGGGGDTAAAGGGLNAGTAAAATLADPADWLFLCPTGLGTGCAPPAGSRTHSRPRHLM